MGHPFEIPLLKTRSDTALPNVNDATEAKCVVFVVGQLAERGVDYQLLERILGAVHVTLGKEAFLLTVTTESEAPRFTSLRSKLPRVPVLCFGIRPENLDLHMNTILYEPFSFSGFQWVFADALSDISKHVNRKKKLWSALQVVFSVS